MVIVDDDAARLKDCGEGGQAALAETMFGFERGKGALLELCLHGSRQNSSIFEITLPRKLLFFNMPKVVRTERTLRSVDELKHLVCRFFELAPERFLDYEKRLKSNPLPNHDDSSTIS